MSEPLSLLRGRRVGAWGLGRETRALEAQLRKRLGTGFDTVVTDAATLEGSQSVPSGRLDRLSDCDVVVRSPGVSAHRPELEALRRRGVLVTTATALWLSEPRSAPVVGITGTKGKSTTASLVAHLLRAAGAQVSLAGNIGTPAIDLLDVEEADVVVLELSSYQTADLLHGVDVAVFTNLFPDHVHWHGTTERYYADKLRLATTAPVREVLVNACDSRLRELRIEHIVPYGCDGRHVLAGDAVVREGHVVVRATESPLVGRHNLLNLCAALEALAVLGYDVADVPGALTAFEGLPHRLQPVGVYAGVSWVDDSISTIPESTLAALEAFRQVPVILLGGGFDRAQDYAQLGAELARRGATVIGLPTTGSRLVQAAREGGAADELLHEVADLEQGVAVASACARPGSVVLLSPAAPSFGEFLSFEERGLRFAQLIGRPSGAQHPM